MQTIRLTIIVILAAGAVAAYGQVPEIIYDAREESGASGGATEAEIAVVRRGALAAVRKAWGSECAEEIEFLGAATGSFTAANGPAERVILYRYCETGHGFANNGLVVLRGTRIMRNIVYNGGSDHSISAVKDLNANGISEIVLAGGSTHQGYTKSVISLIELTSAGVKTYGDADVYEDDCGAREKCRETAYVILGKRGATPAFFRDTFTKVSGKWRPAGARRTLKLRKSYQEPPIVYRTVG